MAMDNRGRSSKSLCEKSMEMVTNMVKLSSFCIAKMSLGTAGRPPPATTRSLASFSGSSALPPFPAAGSQRAQEPKSSSKPVSYLIEPTEGNRSSYVIREEPSVDGKASDYIRKVHEKNRHDHSSEASTPSPYILPPPPHALM